MTALRRSSTRPDAAAGLLAVLVLAATACGGGTREVSRATSLPIRPTVAPTEFPDDPDEELESPEAPESPIPGSVRLVFTSAGDEIQLSGRLFGERQPAGVILLPPSDRDATAWYAMAQRLSASGYLALAMDFRGTGRSRGNRDPAAYPKDVAGAIEALSAAGADRYAVVGAQAGGTAAVAAASARPAGLRAVVALDAGPVFESLDASSGAGKVTAKALLVASKGGSTDELAAAMKNPKRAQVDVSGDALADPSVQDAILAFLRDALPR